MRLATSLWYYQPWKLQAQPDTLKFYDSRQSTLTGSAAMPLQETEFAYPQPSADSKEYPGMVT